MHEGRPWLPKADLYLDCRGLREYDIGYQGIGSEPEFQQAILVHNAAAIASMTRLVEDSLPQIEARHGTRAEASPYVVCTFCAWGINRSVATKYLLAQYFRNKGFTVKLV